MTIETARLRLRPYREGDARDLYALLHAPTVHCFACMALATPSDAERALKERIGDESGLYLAITLKDSGRIIGEIFSEPESTDPESHHRDTYSPCWMLHPDYQGRGYAFEAAEAYIDHLFAERDARRIYVYTEDYNLPCQKLCARLGLRKEGEFAEFVSFVRDANGDPIYENTWQYAILKKEWHRRTPDKE